ncbi:MAG: hypothetical protein ABSG19_13375 [Candidatus Aminicenantales bacterium]
MKVKALLRPLTAAEAKRAVFIDFEGTRKDSPSLLGVYVAGRKSFSQTVLEQALYPAVKYRSPKITWPVKAGGPAEALDKLRRVVESRRLRVFSWTTLEQRTILKLLKGFPKLKEFWRDRIEDGIPYAKAWKRRVRPDVKLSRKKGRGPNTLENYEKLIGFKRHTIHGWGLTGKRVRGVRAALAKRRSMKKLTRIQKGYWTNLLIHNKDDCRGMAEVMAVVAGASRIRRRIIFSTQS